MSTEQNKIYISGQVRCKLRGILGVCYIVRKRRELWSTNGFKLDRTFYPPSVNSAFHFIPGSLMGISKWNSITRCQTVDGRPH